MTEPLLIGDVFRSAARAVPQRPAAALGERVLTFGELDARSNRVARALGRRGIGVGDRVATWTATTLGSVPLFAALAKTGAVFAPLNGQWEAHEASEVLTRLRPALVVADAERAQRGRSLAEGPGFELVALEALEAEAAHESSEDVTVALEEVDTHVVFYTSGSSGTPKGAVLSHRANVLRSLSGILLEPRGAMVCPYPLFHMGAWTIALQQWQARDAVVFVEPATAPEIGAAVERWRATRLNCVPAVWQRLLAARAAPGGPDLSSLRFADTGTSATSPELLRAIAAALPGAQVRVFYGSTEAGSVSVLEHADIERKPGSCGVPGPLARARVGEDGRLWVRGPLLFDGYLDDPEATGAAVVDGWYDTGDLAEVDDEGYLTIVGRVGDLIRTGGEAVAPAEVEEVLRAHPQVDDVAVVGVPDSAWGQVVCAVVVVAPGGRAPALEDLRAACVGVLAPYKHPRRLALV
ncbi:MAG TPA: class I adenylate-forming enzyme family protein, partial [Acidimicrobiales bacterium]|nr:class I adenylate-forming enzyme family protein [Acidimicrobiales bacterium]